MAAKMVPVHARDVWALGNFFLAVIEEVGLEGRALRRWGYLGWDWKVGP